MKSIAVLGLAGILAGCAGPGISHYANQQPVLDPMQYFQGKTQAWGMFQKRDGEVVKRFVVDMTGTVNGDKLTLDEQFSYSDGTKQQRVWTLTRDANGGWRGTADDVVGEARGELAGNAFHWAYVLRLPVDGRVWEVDFDDWMYLIDGKTMVNRARMSKWGFELGQVTLFFRKD